MTTDTMTATSVEATIHPRWVRVCHWVNALAILVMIGSGWQIYNASPLFDFLVFPRQIALGNALAKLALAFSRKSPRKQAHMGTTLCMRQHIGERDQFLA